MWLRSVLVAPLIPKVAFFQASHLTPHPSHLTPHTFACRASLARFRFVRYGSTHR